MIPISEKTRREFMKDLAACGVALPLLSFPPPALSFPSLALSTRETLNLGDTLWRFARVDAFPSAKEPSFNDSQWGEIGVPHCFNDTDTYQNLSQNQAFRGTASYRKHLRIDSRHKGKKFYLEFQSVDVGAAVYVNGKFKPGNTAVPQPQEVTHVGCFLPFVLDITDDIQFDGDNVLAVRISNSDRSFFAWPGFGAFLGLGMGFGGIVGPVYLHILDPVHIPLNVYSSLNKWGTQIGAVAISTATAKLRFRVNVENGSDVAKEVVLVSHVLDANSKAVLTLRASHFVGPKTTFLFDHSGEVPNPHLWFPNNSPHGTPYLYRVVNTVEVEGKAVDSVVEYFGIRTITWDGDYCYVNNNKHLLNGFGLRNSYPALGASVPAELQWKDMQLIAECGGNALRIGHIPAALQTIAACDAYGIMVISNSGDDEWSLHGEPALTYKREYDRDMLVSFRNHPSIAVWESNNGIASKKAHDYYSPETTEKLVDQWDNIQPRIVSSRDTSEYWPKDRRIMIGYTANYKKVAGSPSINMECYSRGAARFDYEHEKEFADFFVNQYNANIGDKACGWIYWMLAEAMESPFLPFLDGKTNQKALGSCALDGNRFPKLAYRVFQNAIWARPANKPGVTLQSHWNLSGRQTVDAWSNCPSVELFVNGVSHGIRIPNARCRCTWEKVLWKPGELKAVGRDQMGNSLCADRRQTAGAPHRIRLYVEPNLVKPDGDRFHVRANGTDVALITATIVDANGFWCPLAAHNLRFSVAGPGSYRGSYNFYVSPGKPASYHSPDDHELQAEGGLMRIAVRSTFESGLVRVTAAAAGLQSGTTSFITAT
ncbi:MAG: glycoside hydrolase family 2 protein [Terracidiphilus sp.]